MSAQLELVHVLHNYTGDCCHLQLQLAPQPVTKSVVAAASATGSGKQVENIRNCDVFVEDFHLLFYSDVHLFKFQSQRQLDVKDMKQLLVQYQSNTRSYHFQLPCLPQSAVEIIKDKAQPEKGEIDRKSLKYATETNTLDLWKLKRVTDTCKLQVDNNAELLQFVANFDYGFAGKFKGKLEAGDSNMSEISRMPEPHLSSPLQRTIDREIDELKNFSRDQYKLNFVELQVPEGHENPMTFTINFNATTLTKDEQCLLHNLTCKAEDLHLPDIYDQSEVDCGLISILLAICYDVRSTINDVTCESAWTRSILSATLTYFEPHNNLKDVVISFLRRSLIYPLYRNYDLARSCVQDAIDALQKSPSWLLQQLLVTHELFATCDSSREVFNRYYIEDYIRYVSNETPCTVAHLRMLARNLKNVLLDVSKKHLHLDLGDIETELLKELIEDIHLNESEEEEDEYEEEEEEDEDEDDNECEGVGTESDVEDERETSSASETEENSVIEQRMDALKV